MAPRLDIRKEDALCCLTSRDADGRLPIGYCGPDCIRRPGNHFPETEVSRGEPVMVALVERPPM